MPKKKEPARKPAGSKDTDLKFEIPKNISNFINQCSEAYGKLNNEWFACSVWTTCRFHVESPIEQIFLTAFRLSSNINGLSDPIFIDCGEWDKYPLPKDHGVFIYFQYKINKYRVDFKILFNKHNGESKEVIVECDSQAFHERSEIERRYEKCRDRFLINNGYTVFHFTGTEIVNEPFRVTAEVITFLTGRDFKEVSQCEDYL